ncbi:hypothetical protein DLAC_11468 [Tieghemostelium lacteum]|uniref:Uncharacterized protein n=1 Tax=Tieghemostelium lacteum TaxID=361077 RepID=A0A152A894_TIELA|nr:hypothetical protein DLAC_11468 [Tieghemostelium lacteum]|eukprot:KYR02361.1 hypothetical protein DLAC_11468 [Tieghemostelium lacteum]
MIESRSFNYIQWMIENAKLDMKYVFDYNYTMASRSNVEMIQYTLKHHPEKLVGNLKNLKSTLEHIIIIISITTITRTLVDNIKILLQLLIQMNQFEPNSFKYYDTSIKILVTNANVDDLKSLFPGGPTTIQLRKPIDFPEPLSDEHFENIKWLFDNGTYKDLVKFTCLATYRNSDAIQYLLDKYYNGDAQQCVSDKGISQMSTSMSLPVFELLMNRTNMKFTLESLLSSQVPLDYIKQLIECQRVPINNLTDFINCRDKETLEYFLKQKFHLILKRSEFIVGDIETLKMVAKYHTLTIDFLKLAIKHECYDSMLFIYNKLSTKPTFWDINGYVHIELINSIDIQMFIYNMDPNGFWNEFTTNERNTLYHLICKGRFQFIQFLVSQRPNIILNQVNTLFLMNNVYKLFEILLDEPGFDNSTKPPLKISRIDNLSLCLYSPMEKIFNVSWVKLTTESSCKNLVKIGKYSNISYLLDHGHIKPIALCLNWRKLSSVAILRICNNIGSNEIREQTYCCMFLRILQLSKTLDHRYFVNVFQVTQMKKSNNTQNNDNSKINPMEQLYSNKVQLTNDIVDYKRKILDLDQRNNLNIEAIDIIDSQNKQSKPKSKMWIYSGDIFIQLKSKETKHLLLVENDHMESEIEKLRTEIKDKEHEYIDNEKKLEKERNKIFN